MQAMRFWDRLLLILMLLTGCAQERLPADTQKADSANVFNDPRYPGTGKTLVLVGQDVQSIDGYLKHVDPDPAGFMIYTDIRYLSGLDTPADDGGGLRHAAHYTQNPEYDHTVVQMGLWMVDQLKPVIAGKCDKQINKLGQWIKSVKRPVYLRIGYEFDGPWNHYEPADYVLAYRHIVDQLRAMQVINVVYVWSSAAAPGYHGYALDAWYPGDAYVDWIGISVFRQFAGTLGTTQDLHRVCHFAQTHHKPIGIMESTPYGSVGGITDKTWDNWFMPMFKLIEQYDIRMLCYINANWDTQKMWAGQGWGDTRLQNNPTVIKKWLETISKVRYVLNENKTHDVLPYVLSQ